MPTLSDIADTVQDKLSEQLGVFVRLLNWFSFAWANVKSAGFETKMFFLVAVRAQEFDVFNRSIKPIVVPMVKLKNFRNRVVSTTIAAITVIGASKTTLGYDSRPNFFQIRSLEVVPAFSGTETPALGLAVIGFRIPALFANKRFKFLSRFRSLSLDVPNCVLSKTCNAAIFECPPASTDEDISAGTRCWRAVALAWLCRAFCAAIAGAEISCNAERRSTNSTLSLLDMSGLPALVRAIVLIVPKFSDEWRLAVLALAIHADILPCQL